MARKNKKRKIISKVFTIILLIINLLFFGLTFILNVIPMKYMIIIIGVFVLIDILTIILLFSKKRFKRIIGIILSIILSIIMLLGSLYEFNTIDFFGNFNKNNYKTLNYNILILKSSDYDEIKDLKNKRIGLLKDEHYIEVIKNIKDKISFKEQNYNNITELLMNLIDEKLEAVIIEESQYTILTEENSDYSEILKTLHTFSLDIEVENFDKAVDVTKKPFNIYISGIDSYGKITSVSRSDVNIVATVNPNTHDIVLTSIPRDYYVRLHGTTGYKDKLTHAGVYGIEKSVETIEDLLEIDINYYIKVNFTSLIKIVDLLGGITVNSNYSFISLDGYHYNKGYNNLNGKEALSFVRERKAFKDGDRVRGENQQLVLEAIINKALSPKIITKYNSLLNALDNSFVSNMDNSDITSLIKKQINDNPSWNFSTINLNGTDAYDYTYSYSANKLYVMIPDEESLKNAQEKLANILN